MTAAGLAGKLYRKAREEAQSVQGENQKRNLCDLCEFFAPFAINPDPKMIY